jgi:hypothetical protein
VLGSFRQFGAMAYNWKRLMPATHTVFFERPWMEGNITVDKGPLAGAYEPNDGAFRSEGDSPAFMHQIEVGLRSLESPEYGGWGGRFVAEKPGATNVWKDAEDDGDLYKPIWRWVEAFQNDWAARADWSVKPWRQANHAPVVLLQTPKDVQAAPGSTVTVSVRGSTDPDGDKLSTRGGSTARPEPISSPVVVRDEDRAVASVAIPADAKAGRYDPPDRRGDGCGQTAADPLRSCDRDCWRRHPCQRLKEDAMRTLLADRFDYADRRRADCELLGQMAD